MKRAFSAVDVTMARVRKQSLSILKDHAAAQEALGEVRKLTPLELKALRTLDGEDAMAFIAVEDGVAGTYMARGVRCGGDGSPPPQYCG